MRTDVLYVEGPGDIVSAFRSWCAGEAYKNETSVTYSSQVFSFCEERCMSLMAVSYCAVRSSAHEGEICVRNLPRRMFRLPKVGYHLSLAWFACRILRLAVIGRPRLILITSGVISWNAARIISRIGFNIVPVLHNALWPEGFPSRTARELGWWESKYPPVTLVVSSVIKRQIASIGGSGGSKAIEFRPSFNPDHFFPCRVQSHRQRPFKVIFVGRLEEDKGVFDLIHIAAMLEEVSPGSFYFDICGAGSRAADLDREVKARELQCVVGLWGRLDRTALLQRYAQSHVCIVPTRSTFAEGFAQVVAESILLCRPVVTSSVVPASEPYRKAVVLAKTDDVQSYVDALLSLQADKNKYDHLAAACGELRASILDMDMSFLSALRKLELPSAWPASRQA